MWLHPQLQGNMLGDGFSRSVQNNLTEMKAFASPPPAVVTVAAAVMVLLASGGKIPKDKSWKAAKASIMSKVTESVTNCASDVCFFKTSLTERRKPAMSPG